MREFGPVLVVDDEAAAVVHFEADSVVAEAVGVGAAANGDEDDVGGELDKSCVSMSSVIDA